MRHLLPHEHSLWAWVGGPLLLALVLAPGLGTLLAVGAAIAGFGVWNAGNTILSGKPGAAGPAVSAGAVAVVLGAGALATVPDPDRLFQVFVAATVVSHVVGLGTGGKPPRNPLFEVAGILALAELGAGIAIAGGADLATVECAELMLASWFILGMWFVKRQLSSVLRRREPFPMGLWLGLGVALVAEAVGVWNGRSMVALVLPLYAIRAVIHPAPVIAQDVPRVGMTEAAWSAVAVVALGVLLQLG